MIRARVTPGRVRMRVLHDSKHTAEKFVSLAIKPLDRQIVSFELDIPARPGKYQLEAALIEATQPSARSLRDFVVR